MDKPILLFTYGPPAAGKTTFSKWFAQNYNFKYVGADEVRKAIYGSTDEFGNSELIYHCLLESMNYHLKNGNSVIYDATNLRKDYRLDYLNFIETDCYKWIYTFKVDEKIAEQRHANRNRDIPWENLQKYFSISEFPTLDEGWDVIEDKTNLLNSIVKDKENLYGKRTVD